MGQLDQPGASMPRPGGDPTAPISDAEVEKTLRNLESMTSTLVQEVGRSATAVASSPDAAIDPTPDAAAAATATTEDVQAASATRVDNISDPAELQQDTLAPTLDQPSDPAALTPQRSDAAPAGPQASASIVPVSQLAVAPELVVTANEAPGAAGNGEPPETAPADVAAQPDGGGVTDKPEPAAADAEVEQEISQAIHQLQSGQPVAAAPAQSRDLALRRSSIVRTLLGGLTKCVGAVLYPLGLLAIVLDLPFRWMPGALKHLLGYVAVGTALMTGALWYYIIMIRQP